MKPNRETQPCSQWMKFLLKPTRTSLFCGTLSLAQYFSVVILKCDALSQLLIQHNLAVLYYTDKISIIWLTGNWDSSQSLLDLYLYERLSFFGCLVSKSPKCVFLYFRHSMFILIIKIIRVFFFLSFFLFFPLSLWKFSDYSRLVTYINIQHIYT